MCITARPTREWCWENRGSKGVNAVMGKNVSLKDSKRGHFGKYSWKNQEPTKKNNQNQLNIRGNVQVLLWGVYDSQQSGSTTTPL